MGVLATLHHCCQGHRGRRSLRSGPAGGTWRLQYLLSRLGRGEGEIVAVKELFPVEVAERLDDGKVGIEPEHRQDFDTAIRSLRHEAEVLQKLTQVPSVVRVGDVFQDNDTAYLSLEYLRGRSYEKYLLDHTTKSDSNSTYAPRSMLP